VTPLPALLGGIPVRPEGPPDWPPRDPSVDAAIGAALVDGSWGKYQGGHVERLEQRLAQMHGVGHALTCASGTFAVELALRALKVEPGDEVILSAYDYPGNFLTVHALGARPVLIEVDDENATVNLEAFKESVGPKTKAVIVSHLHGGLVPMRRLMHLAHVANIRVIEDACQCPGAVVEGRPAGTWGDVGVLSFGGSKLLTAGRGGAIITTHTDVFQRARLCQNRANVLAPLSELQAVALLPQLDQLAARNEQRQRAVTQLLERCATLPGLRPFAMSLTDSHAGYYKVGFRYDAAAFGISRAVLTAAMRAEGIALDEGFRALHIGRSPSRYRAAGSLTNASRASEDVVILHHPILIGSEADIEQIAVAFDKIHRYREALK